MNVPDEIITQAYNTKKGVYSDIYDINSDTDYEGNIKEIEAKYLAALSAIHANLNKILTGEGEGEGENDTSSFKIPNISSESKKEFDRLVVAILSARSDDPVDNIPIKSFIDNYFFRYAWWLGETKID